MWRNSANQCEIFNRFAINAELYTRNNGHMYYILSKTEQCMIFIRILPFRLTAVRSGDDEEWVTFDIRPKDVFDPSNSGSPNLFDFDIRLSRLFRLLERSWKLQNVYLCGN